MKFGFGRFELDLATCQLRQGEHNVPLQPRVFGTLRYLIEHRDRVVGKQELIDALWGGYQLNAVAVPWTINRARKALGDQSGEFIETVRGHGYRFVAELRVLEPGSGARSAGTPPASQMSEPVQAIAERPFVGRAPVMQRLTAALDAAAAGHGRLYLLSGEAGIGKTRCADELALLARRRGLQVWVGRCFEHGGAPAFWPFIQVMRTACADASLHESVRQEGIALLHEFEPRSTDDQRSADSSEDARFWLLDRLCRWLCRSAKNQVRVIELDDLHCADESSLQALSLLAPLLAESNMLVLATAREQDGASSGRSVSALASRLRPCEHVPLLGLHSEDVQSYLRAVLDDELAVRLSQALYARTAGNPLFLNEIAHVVIAQYEREGRIDVADVQLPAAVTEIISVRLQQLPAVTRRLLDAACVIGEAFGLPVLQRVAKCSANDVLSGLQAAVQVNIIAPRSDGATLVFTHPLMREVLYKCLSTAQRAHLHVEVGLALETLGVIDPPLNELAYHFHHAPLEAYYARAARYGRLAGDAALAALAHDEAVQAYAWALEAQARAAPEDLPAACELLLMSAFALAMAGRGLEGRKQCERAIELAIEAKLPEIMITAARLLRPSVWLAHMADPLALNALERALQMLPEDARAQRSRAYAQLASIPPHSLRLATSRSLSEQAVRLASDSDDPMLKFEAQRSRLFGLCGADSIDEQLRVAHDMLRSDQERTWRWGADAHFACYHASMQRGDAAAADRALNAYKLLVTTRRLRMQTWHCERLRAQRLLDAGMLDASERRFEELALDAQRLRVPLGAAYARAQRFVLNLERTGKRLTPEMSEPPVIPAWAQRLPAQRVLHIHFALELGERDRARREFHDMAQDGFAAVSDEAFGLFTLVHLAGISIELDERDAAQQLRDLLAPHQSLVALSPFTLSRGCVARYLGQLEVYLGRLQHARDYFLHASDVNARSGHELQRLHSQFGLADCVARGRTQVEREQARKLATHVASAAEGIGALALATTSRELAISLGPASRPARQSSQRVKAQRGRAHAKGS